MTNRVTNKQKDSMWRMYLGGKSISKIAKFLDIPYNSAWITIECRRKGFKANREYYENFAQQKGFDNYKQYRGDLAKRKGYQDYKQYLEDSAKRNGFQRITQYRKHCAQKRSQKKENKELSNLIKSRLKELGKTQNWLANQIGVTRQALSLYCSGENIPREEKLEKIFLVFKLERASRNLDGLLI